MTVTMYGIKSCSTMKKTFVKLGKMGITYKFHNYKKQEIGKEKNPNLGKPAWHRYSAK